ncbi:hypothetical protein AUJ83_00620 [Candidatus Woesearchaeota archaeon CG1_02_33_12]|nr:MAG: hypothetical protein AUJ83_00620 [Candidatus Woesearchaeota archaeon CG1_02_33_12]
MNAEMFFLFVFLLTHTYKGYNIYEIIMLVNIGIINGLIIRKTRTTAMIRKSSMKYFENSSFIFLILPTSLLIANVVS